MPISFEPVDRLSSQTVQMLDMLARDREFYQRVADDMRFRLRGDDVHACIGGRRIHGDDLDVLHQVPALNPVELWVTAHLACSPLVTFRPTLEECLALEKIRPNVSIHHYRQPASTVLIDLPGSYRLLSGVFAIAIHRGISNRRSSFVGVLLFAAGETVSYLFTAATATLADAIGGDSSARGAYLALSALHLLGQHNRRSQKTPSSPGTLRFPKDFSLADVGNKNAAGHLVPEFRRPVLARGQRRKRGFA